MRGATAPRGRSGCQTDGCVSAVGWGSDAEACISAGEPGHFLHVVGGVGKPPRGFALNQASPPRTHTPCSAETACSHLAGQQLRSGGSERLGEASIVLGRIPIIFWLRARQVSLRVTRRQSQSGSASAKQRQHGASSRLARQGCLLGSDWQPGMGAGADGRLWRGEQGWSPGARRPAPPAGQSQRAHLSAPQPVWLAQAACTTPGQPGECTAGLPAAAEALRQRKHPRCLPVWRHDTGAQAA